MQPSLLSWAQHARRFSAKLTLGLLLPAAALAAPASPQAISQQQLETMLPQIESYIQTTMEAWKVPGVALGIVVDDKLAYAKGFGVRKHGSTEPVDADTLFQLGSASKAFLGVTEAILVDQGKMAWTDKVVDYVPDFRVADPWVTQNFEVADLLAQRSGLPGWTLTNMALYDYSPDDIIRALRYIKPITSFRSSFAYQNAFHLVAGKLVAHLGNTDSWEQFLQSELLTPLGMSSTSYTAKGIAQSPNHASGHRSEDNKITVDPWAPFPYNAGGAGNLNSNVNDMSRWLRFQINQGEIDGKRLVSAKVMQETHRARIAVTGMLADAM